VDKKQKYIWKILRKYGVLVNFSGEISKQNLPSNIEGENFNQWTTRVLGRNTSDVQVYLPIQPHGNNSIEGISNASDIDFLKDILRSSLKIKDKEKQSELEQSNQEHKERIKAQRSKLKNQKEAEIKRTREVYATIGADTLSDILDETSYLQPSVREFLTGFITSDEAAIDIETLLKELVIRHNDAARTIQQLKDQRKVN